MGTDLDTMAAHMNKPKPQAGGFPRDAELAAGVGVALAQIAAALAGEAR